VATSSRCCSSSAPITSCTRITSRISALLYGFYLFRFFSSFGYRYFLLYSFFNLRPLIFPTTICFLILYYFTFSVPCKPLISFFSSCARLNWQLACQFFSANHCIVSYRIVSYDCNLHRSPKYTVAVLTPRSTPWRATSLRKVWGLCPSGETCGVPQQSVK